MIFLNQKILSSNMHYLQLRIGAYLAAKKIPAELHRETDKLALYSEAGTLHIAPHFNRSPLPLVQNVSSLTLSFTYAACFPEILQQNTWDTKGYFPALFHTQPILGLQKDLLLAHRYFVKSGCDVARAIAQQGVPDCTDSLDAMVDWARTVHGLP